MSIYLAGSPGDILNEHVRSAQILVYMVVFAAGVTIAGAARLLFRGGAETARHSVIWLCMVVVAVFAYTSKAEIEALYERARGNIYPSVALSRTQNEAEFRRTWDGHYRVEARINGVRERLLIDTGASMVLLPYETIHEFGIEPDSLDYSTPVTTANGQSTVAPITIETIRIGTIEVFDVPAAVAQPGRLKMGLLGMSFLDKLEETSFKGDRLILRK
ncbi:MAG: TIGR02281 family clan AA aspartic protease [Pseudomonadota bacterium]